MKPRLAITKISVSGSFSEQRTGMGISTGYCTRCSCSRKLFNSSSPTTLQFQHTTDTTIYHLTLKLIFKAPSSHNHSTIPWFQKPRKSREGMNHQAWARLMGSAQAWPSPCSIRVCELIRVTLKCGKCTGTPFRNHANSFGSNELPGCGAREGGRGSRSQGSSFQHRRFEWRMLHCRVPRGTKEGPL